MASIKLELNSKGCLQAKVQVSCKDFRTGKNKIYAKRFYNTNNLSEAKFKKYVEKESFEFEASILKAYKEAIEFRSRVLTFAELTSEWKESVRQTLSHNYYLRIEDCENKFNLYLQQKGLYYKPISEITVRDIQLFFNDFFVEQDRVLPYVSLKKDICKNIPEQDIYQNSILTKCSRFYKKKSINLTIKNAREICDKYGLNFNEYFGQCTVKIKYSPVTIKGYRRVLRAVFNEALRYEWITKNPVCFTKITSTGNNGELLPINEKEVFSIKESQDFLKLLSEEEPLNIHRTIPIKIMLLTGLRNGEIHGLKWSDIDFDKRIIRVVRSRLYSNKQGVYEKVPKTKTSIREVPMSAYLIEELKKFKEWYKFADKDFENKLDKYYITVNMFREPSNPDGLGDWLAKFEKRHNLKKVTCHGLRHTYCSLLLSQNVPIQTVSKYMGHSDSTITLRVYSHFIPDTKDIAINAIDDIINKKGSNKNDDT